MRGLITSLYGRNNASCIGPAAFRNILQCIIIQILTIHNSDQTEIKSYVTIYFIINLLFSIIIYEKNIIYLLLIIIIIITINHNKINIIQYCANVNCTVSRHLICLCWPQPRGSGDTGAGGRLEHELTNRAAGHTDRARHREQIFFYAHASHYHKFKYRVTTDLI